MAVVFCCPSVAADNRHFPRPAPFYSANKLELQTTHVSLLVVIEEKSEGASSRRHEPPYQQASAVFLYNIS